MKLFTKFANNGQNENGEYRLEYLLIKQDEINLNAKLVQTPNRYYYHWAFICTVLS